jgi:iron complex outermembrane receptor protein
LFSEIAWQLPDHSINAGAEIIAASNMYASDANSSNSNASGYVISNLRIFARQHYENWRFTELARLNNIFDTYYIGSVIINQASNQYFEPSPGRNWFVGVNASLQF